MISDPAALLIIAPEPAVISTARESPVIVPVFPAVPLLVTVLLALELTAVDPTPVTAIVPLLFNTAPSSSKRTVVF